MSAGKKYHKKILVLNGDIRNGLAIIRSLGRRGCVCDITASADAFGAKFLKKALHSRYTRRTFFLPDSKREQEYIEALLDLLKTEKYDYLFCAGTQVTNLVSKHKQRLSALVRPLVEDFDKIWLVHDKISCLKWAESLKVPIPKTYYIGCLEDLRKAAGQIDHPVVVKWPDSFASIGLWSYPHGGEGLVEEYLKKVPEIVSNTSEGQYPIIQEQAMGALMDTTAFAVAGETKAVLSQERLVTAWLDGGGGLVNITNDIPEIKEYTTLLLRELQWTGPIEMDWIVDRANNTCKLLEINPKFWGTTQLTISAGFDYPYWLLQYAENEEIQAPGSYRPRLMARWIFDELGAILVVARDKARLRKEMRAFFSRFGYHPCVTDIWLSDFKPSLIACISFCKRVLKRGLFFRQLWRLVV